MTLPATTLLGALLADAFLTEHRDERYGSATPSSGWRERVVRRIAMHEGDFDSLNRNTDGQGLSFGIIQWAQRPGKLGTILRSMQGADPEAFADIFGPSWPTLLEATRTPGVRPVDGVQLWREPWSSRFRCAGRHPAFQQAQLDQAMYGEWMRGAVEAAATLGDMSERSLTMLFDRAVQQGPDKVVATAESIARRWPGHHDKLGLFTRLIAGNLRLDSAPSRPTTPLGNTWREVSPGEWHLFANNIDLYESVQRRIRSILTDHSIPDSVVV